MGRQDTLQPMAWPGLAEQCKCDRDAAGRKRCRAGPPADAVDLDLVPQGPSLTLRPMGP